MSRLRYAWWYLSTWLFYYGYHPRHFYRIGWRIYVSRPRSVILSKRWSLSSTAMLDLDRTDRDWVAQRSLKELKRDMTRFKPFVARWHRPELHSNPVMGDFRSWTWIVEGEINKQTKGGKNNG